MRVIEFSQLFSIMCDNIRFYPKPRYKHIKKTGEELK